MLLAPFLIGLSAWLARADARRTPGARAQAKVTISWMAALGVSTRFVAIRQAGARPRALALILFLWLVVGGAVIHRGVAGLLA